MKKFLALTALVLGVATEAFATPNYQNCSTGTLTSYLNNATGCIIGNDVFNQFSFVAVGVLTPIISTDNITVTPVVGPNGPSVTFTGNFAAGGLLAASAEYLLGFEATALDAPFIEFSKVNLAETGSVSQNALTLVPTGTASVAELDCFGGLLQLPNVVNHLVGVACLGSGPAVGATSALGTGVGVSANVDIQFAPHTYTVDVLKDITLTADLGGSASITSITQAFTTAVDPNPQTPEPATFFLGGCGLIGLAFIKRKRRAQE